MFSTAQQAYIDALLPTYAKDGYKYYVVYSNNVGNSGYNTPTNPDLYAVFSKKAISAEDAYTYGLQDSSILVTIRCGNYSSSNYANNSDRITVTDYTADTLKIPVYEHVYTNAEFSGHTLQPNYYLTTGGETNVQIEALTTIVLAVVVFVALRKLIFKR